MVNQRKDLAGRFEAAAASLTAAAGTSGLESGDPGLLRYLGYDDGQTAKAEGRARMLRAAARFRRLFLLPSPDAPSIAFFGGEADPAVLGEEHTGSPIGSFVGSGLSPQRAFEACVGEGIEHLSQFAQPGSDGLRSGSFTEHRDLYDPDTDSFVSAVLAAGKVDPHRSITWISARRLPDGAKVWFPLDLWCRRPAAQQDFAPPLKLSTGCAAGVTIAAATLRAALELVERDAVALWWRGGRRGRPIAPDGEAGRAAAELLAQARQKKSERESWLVDITTDVEVPAVAAFSARPDGYGFAYGFAARLTLADAVRASIFELFQVELGHHVVAAKRGESGDEKLNENDRRQLKRGTLFNTKYCTLLQPIGPPHPISRGIPEDEDSGFRYVLGRLAALGIAAYTLDLTRAAFGIPVVRVFAPGLQLEPCEIVGPRLAGAMRETGGGAVHHPGVPLL